MTETKIPHVSVQESHKTMVGLERNWNAQLNTSLRSASKNADVAAYILFSFSLD